MADLSTRQRNKQLRRTRIIECAAGLIADGGDQALTLRDLAGAAGVTVPTIYNLIGSREDVVVEVVTDAMDQMDAELSRLSEERGIEHGLAAVDACFDLILARKTLYRAVFRALFEMEATAVPQWMGRMFRRGGEVMEQAILRAVRDRDLRGDLEPLPLAHNAFHALQATIRMWAVGALDTRNSRARSRYAYLTTLLADATPKGRKRLLAMLRDAEATLNH